MSDLVKNHIVGFPTRQLLYCCVIEDLLCCFVVHNSSLHIEPPGEKTNNVVSEKV